MPFTESLAFRIPESVVLNPNPWRQQRQQRCGGSGRLAPVALGSMVAAVVSHAGLETTARSDFARSPTGPGEG